MVWSLTAAWMSANNVISVRSELFGYWLCAFGLGLGAYLWRGATESLSSSRRARFGAGALALAGMMLLGSWYGSQDIFMRWKVLAIPEASRLTMASALAKLGTEAAAKGAEGYSRVFVADLPDAVNWAGLKKEYSWGSVETALPDAPVTVRLVYGGRGRRWGVYLGAEWRLKQAGNYSIHRIADGCSLFVGTQ